MTFLRGEFQDFSYLDRHRLVSADDHEQAQMRIEHSRLSARPRTLPDYHPDDIDAVSSGSWARLYLDELGYNDGQPDKLGARLYLLAFEGIAPYIKIGMVEGNSLKALHDRVRRHEHDARVHQYFLFDAWASQPCATKKIAKQWEDLVRAQLDTCVTGDQVRREHKEYYYGIPFHVAETAIEMQRLNVDGAPQHPGVNYGA